MNLLNDECRSIKRRGILLLVFLMLLCLFPFSGAMGAEQEAWPEDLTLSYALAQASGKHPTLQIASSNVDQARALLRGVDAQTRLQSQLSARLRWVDPPAIALDQSQDDHRLSLSIDKPLYDFGRSSAQLAAGNAAILSAQQRFQDAQNQHRIAILAAFFEVILADLAYARDNEDMSMGYVRLDRARQRNELGQLSDIELLAARSEYQTMRVQRYRSSSAQRSTRAHLANVLNRPGQLPAELQLPRLTVLQRSIPEDVDAWLTEAEQNNALLSAYQLRVKQAHEQLNVARASDNPSLSANAEISRHSRETSGRDNWRAGVLLNVPIISGGRNAAERAEQRAKIIKVRAELEQHWRDVSQAILEIWGELHVLKVAQESAQIDTEYRDLYLDRSRVLYELEVKSDLGDAMVKTTAVRYQATKTNFMMALSWARLDALLGRVVFAEQSSSSSAKMENPP